MKILMIDNYDSFTFNLVQYLWELGTEVDVVRNDEIRVDEIGRRQPDAIVISPGPCTPNEAGISLSVVERYAGILPILGVCLGYQAIGQALGAKVVRARAVMHGKVSPIHHTDRGVFQGLENPLEATRYHSLIVAEDSIPASLEITAWTEFADGRRDEVMGFRHRELALEGVQFHPESILTRQGHELLQNFLNQSAVTAGSGTT